MSILDLISKHLDPQTVGSLAGTLGIDSQKAGSALSSALPVILGALAKNTQSPQGAASLDTALAKDHDGSVLDHLVAAAPALMGSGQKILGHVFGEKKDTAVDGVAQKSGLAAGDVLQLLSAAAPVVLGVIGKMKKEEKLDANGVAQALQSDAEKVQTESSGLMAMLDTNKDGSVVDDVVKHGGALLSALFTKKS